MFSTPEPVAGPSSLNEVIDGLKNTDAGWDYMRRHCGQIASLIKLSAANGLPPGFPKKELGTIMLGTCASLCMQGQPQRAVDLAQTCLDSQDFKTLQQGPFLTARADALAHVGDLRQAAETLLTLDGVLRKEKSWNEGSAGMAVEVLEHVLPVAMSQLPAETVGRLGKMLEGLSYLPGVEDKRNVRLSAGLYRMQALLQDGRSDEAAKLGEELVRKIGKNKPELKGNLRELITATKLSVVLNIMSENPELAEQELLRLSESSDAPLGSLLITQAWLKLGKASHALVSLEKSLSRMDELDPQYQILLFDCKGRIEEIFGESEQAKASWREKAELAFKHNEPAAGVKALEDALLISILGEVNAGELMEEARELWELSEKHAPCSSAHGLSMAAFGLGLARSEAPEDKVRSHLSELDRVMKHFSETENGQSLAVQYCAVLSLLPFEGSESVNQELKRRIELMRKSILENNPDAEDLNTWLDGVEAGVVLKEGDTDRFHAIWRKVNQRAEESDPWDMVVKLRDSMKAVFKF